MRRRPLEKPSFPVVSPRFAWGSFSCSPVFSRRASNTLGKGSLPVKNEKKALRAFQEIRKKYPQFKQQAASSKAGSLFHQEAVIRNQLWQLRSLAHHQPPGYDAVYGQYENLLQDISRRLLARYNQKNRTSYELEAVVKGHRQEYLRTGVMAVLAAYHIPRRVREEFRRLLPKAPQQEYPAARALRRTFILHLGDTNTGKTYQALGRMMESGRGVYLAPLRILALENFERLNKEGVPCDLLTGEEEIRVPGARHLCCTVKMAALQGGDAGNYEVAVIDEVQLLADSQQGDAWTRAILGLCCPEIHLCGAALVQEQLLRMIQDCGDDYVLKQYTRSVPLMVESAPARLSGVGAGDALVAFSKREVLSLSGLLARRGVPNHVIYGDLPPGVRRMQYEAFLGSPKPVLVATDAIGMGVNLPIRRLIFTRQEKFDGETFRPLTPQEVKQIAGRAGRLGIYDVGYVACLGGGIDFIEAMLNWEDEPIPQAVIGPSEAILGIGLLPLREKLALWSLEEEHLPYYRKKDVREYLAILDLLKPYRLPEPVQWHLMRVPFDSENPDLAAQFDNSVRLRFQEGAAKLPRPHNPCRDLADWELYYRQLDLYYAFSKAMEMPMDEEWLRDTRIFICKEIQRLLRNPVKLSQG